MKIVIIGGHFTPALAVIEVLQKQKAEILFVGRKYSLEGDKAESLEYKTITGMGIDFASLSTGRVQRKFTRHTIPSLIKVPSGVLQALSVLQKFRPDVVVGFGGYLSLPVCLAAKLQGIPIVIHEQTLDAGLSNKFISKFAAKICLSWSTSTKYFPSNKTILTGNPLRSSITHSVSKSPFTFKEKLPVIYITGGSLGSHPINELIKGCLYQLVETCNIIHQTGDAKQFGDYQKLLSKRSTLGKKLQERYQVTKFVDPDVVGAVYRQADMVVSRSGINTITELLYFQKPALLIPLPHGQRNEQRKNAQFFADMGLGIVCEQDEQTWEKLFDQIMAMTQNLKQYRVAKPEEITHKDAAEKIVKEIEKVIGY